MSNGSGSWLFAMSKLICNSVDLVNVTLSPIKDVKFNNYSNFTEVLLPHFKLTKMGIPEAKDIHIIQETIAKINPEIIHIWGLEGFWTQLYAKGYIKGNVIVEIQGLLQPCYEVFWGGISPREFVLRSICLRNLLYRNSFLPNRRRVFKEKGNQANAMLKNCKVVSTQSDWVRGQIKFNLSPYCKIYNTLRPIRSEFWEAEKWQKHVGTCRIFTSMSYYLPFKGIHVLIKAVSILKKKYDNVILEIAGVEKKDLIWYRQFSYLKYLQKLSKQLGVADNVIYVGSLTAKQIVEHLQCSDVFVNPSFVESFSASTAEALALGVPTVTAYAGAMPDFSKNRNVALYYSPMDYSDCASKILTLLENHEVREALIKNANIEMESLCSSDKVLERQLSIYECMMSNNV